MAEPRRAALSREVAMPAPPELTDDERFGVVFAQSIGLEADVFADEDDARHWLA